MTHLVLASALNNQLDSVMGNISLERGGRSPHIGTAVRSGVDNCLERLYVLGWAAEEDERDLAGLGGGWRPGDGICLSGFNLLLEAWLDDGISRRVPDWWCIGRCKAERSSKDGNEGELHFS